MSGSCTATTAATGRTRATEAPRNVGWGALGCADLPAALAAWRPALPEWTHSQIAQAPVLLGRNAPTAALEPAPRGAGCPAKPGPSPPSRGSPGDRGIRAGARRIADPRARRDR